MNQLLVMRLAVYLGFNLEHFDFGAGLGATLGPVSPHPDVLNYSWRDYGNRVGVWRCLELFDQLGVATGCIEYHPATAANAPSKVICRHIQSCNLSRIQLIVKKTTKSTKNTKGVAHDKTALGDLGDLCGSSTSDSVSKLLRTSGSR